MKCTHFKSLFFHRIMNKILAYPTNNTRNNTRNAYITFHRIPGYTRTYYTLLALHQIVQIFLSTRTTSLGSVFIIQGKESLKCWRESSVRAQCVQSARTGGPPLPNSRKFRAFPYSPILRLINIPFADANASPA